MRILEGVYPLKNRRLSLTLSHNLEFGDIPTWLHLAGANGLGKTSFIEMILIPALKDQKIPFLYLGQDFRTQLYTLKALLAVSGKEGVRDNIPGLLSQWVIQNQHARVFILDEFDKYADHTQHIFKISRDFIRTYVTVSHLNKPMQPGGPFITRTLEFRELSGEGPILQVGIEESMPWS